MPTTHTPSRERLRCGILESDCAGCGAEIVMAAVGDGPAAWRVWAPPYTTECDGHLTAAATPAVGAEQLPAGDDFVGLEIGTARGPSRVTDIYRNRHGVDVLVTENGARHAVNCGPVLYSPEDSAELLRRAARRLSAGTTTEGTS